MPYQETLRIGTSAPDGGAPMFRRDSTLQERATVTQITSISTAVTCNGYHGTITTFDPALAAGGEAAFTVNNSAVRSGDVVVVSVKSGPADSEHIVAYVTAVSDGSFQIALSNLAAANQGDGAMEINFAVISAPVF